jgi:hypothetical protein
MFHRSVRRSAVVLLAGGLLGGCYLFSEPGFHVYQLSPYDHEITMALSATPQQQPEQVVSRLAFGLCGRAFRFEQPYVRLDDYGEPEKVWPIACM